MSVLANGRSILHKGHGKTQLAIAPDVCKTPSPGGPVPIPYPNMSADSNLTKGAATVKINGNPVANTDSQLSRSNGDEAGVAGGIVSSKNMGAFGWPVGSIDVQAEGKGVVRLLDSCLTNGNTYNTTGVDDGEKELRYGDDLKCPRPNCKLGHVIEKHRIPESKASGIAEECRNFCDEVDNAVAGSSNSFRKRWNRGAGHMVGVGRCMCGKLYKAISGPPADAGHPLATLVGSCNDIGPLAADPFMTDVRGGLDNWSCAALKIISNASGHKIIALSEKWIGTRMEDGSRRGKTYMQHLERVQTSLGFSIQIPLPHDKIPGAPDEPIPSGGSVPSCGRCQTYLPAVICEMTAC
jgi:uncharacterized Zn-binding protein involved in type VI secretion